MSLGLNFGIGKKLGLTSFVAADRLSHAATEFVESLKINSISERKRNGRSIVIKRRNAYGERVADLINFYFALAHLPIRFVSQVGHWRRSEASCFRLLNGDRYCARVTDARTVVLDKLPGKSLWAHMQDGTLTLRMLRAAGKEYRRAHQLQWNGLDGGWSHADASMTNVIYDQKEDRARLIDFEIMHEHSLPIATRRADDLLVFILDMVGRVKGRQWTAFALAFLRAYGDAEVICELKKQLTIPSGLALLWWNVRTNFTSRARTKQRFQILRRAVGELGVYRSTETARRRQKRQPSIHCQTMSAGTPTAKSRQRAINEMANAVSPGIPRRSPITR